MYTYSAKTSGGKVGDQTMLHTSQIIIDTHTLIGYIVDPSLQNKSMLLDRVNNESLKILFRHHLGERFRMETINFETCPGRNLQGINMLCAVWTTYLYLLIFFNPGVNREHFYYVMTHYSQYDRDIMILQFMYYVYLKGVLNLPEFSIGEEHIQYISDTRKLYPLPVL